VGSRLQDLEPWLYQYAEYLVSQLEPYGVTVTSVYRSYTDQLELYRRRASNPYPVAVPGTSKHELRRAWDMVGPDDVLAYAGHVWESWGGRWGGSFHHIDPIHFEA